MPWYYIEARHGGGGQATTVRWVWKDKAIPLKTSADIENLVDEHFAGVYFGERVSFTAKRVNKLPLMVREWKLLGLARAVESAQALAAKMTPILNRTPVHKARCDKQGDLFDRKTAHSSLRADKNYHVPQARCWRQFGHRGKCKAYGVKRNYEKFGKD